MTIQSALLSSIPHLLHGFGTRIEPIPPLVAAPAFNENWDAVRPRWKQVHGISIAEVLYPGQECGEVDSLFTRQRLLPIAVVTADCVPVLLAKRTGDHIAAVHAGWRGTQQRILDSLWKHLRQLGESPRNWVAAIGPAIGPCCYEISSELAEDFLHTFTTIPKSLVTPKNRHLDLQAINAEELKRIGIQDVEILRLCTRCHLTQEDFTFSSYRRDGSGSRQLSMIASV